MASTFNLTSSSFVLTRTITLNPKPLYVPPLPIRRPPSAKFNIPSLLGGRGLCNGEQNLKLELLKNVSPPQPSPPSTTSTSTSPPPVDPFAFDKELFGLTGGFPGGERGLREFISRNPPKNETGGNSGAALVAKPRPPELPLLLPGMIVIVKNKMNPFYMYCGIVQRVTDGKAGVLFEGGNWDKLLTFDLAELERREKGPPMVNPKSAVLESLVSDKS